MAKPSEQRRIDLFEFGRRMSTTIEAIGKSKAAFARSIGCERGRVHHWIKGTAYPDADKVIAMHRVYGITPDWLYLGRLDGLPWNLAEKIAEITEARRDG